MAKLWTPKWEHTGRNVLGLTDDRNVAIGTKQLVDVLSTDTSKTFDCLAIHFFMITISWRLILWLRNHTIKQRVSKTLQDPKSTDTFSNSINSCPRFSLIWRNEFSRLLSWWLWCNWVHTSSNNIATVEAWTQLHAPNTSCNTWTPWLSFSVSARHLTRFVRFGLACADRSTPSTNDWFLVYFAGHR